MATTPNTIETLAVSGAAIPRVGFGTWRLTGETCRDAVGAALKLGYRHVDTAALYENEAEVGTAIRGSGVPRAEVFLTTKVWRDDLRPEALLRSARASLDRLRLDQVDLLLIHWPNAAVPLAETMGALDDACDRGWTRGIGVSNFPVALLDEARRLARHPILANQCEYHPGLDQSALIAACRAGGTAFVSYRPLGQGRQLAEPAVAAIAARHRVTPSQAILRWHVQQPGVVALPRSQDPAHIAENAAVFRFALSEAEMAAIFALGVQNDRHVDPAFAPAWDRPARSAS